MGSIAAHQQQAHRHILRAVQFSLLKFQQLESFNCLPLHPAFPFPNFYPDYMQLYHLSVTFTRSCWNTLQYAGPKWYQEY